MERTAFRNEKRGNLPVAREYCGKCLDLALALAQPEFFDEGLRAFIRRKVEQFQPPVAST